jgi:NAD dependent epimerase/dehydratase family enzyme
MKIVLFGASGLVGGLLVPLLGGHDLTVVGRPGSGVANERVARVEDWPGVIAQLRPDVVISTLGTTIGKAGRARHLLPSIMMLLLPLRRRARRRARGNF